MPRPRSRRSGSMARGDLQSAAGDREVRSYVPGPAAGRRPVCLAHPHNTQPGRRRMPGRPAEHGRASTVAPDGAQRAHMSRRAAQGVAMPRRRAAKGRRRRRRCVRASARERALAQTRRVLVRFSGARERSSNHAANRAQFALRSIGCISTGYILKRASGFRSGRGVGARKPRGAGADLRMDKRMVTDAHG